jgi:conjugative transposon TraN protein
MRKMIATGLMILVLMNFEVQAQQAVQSIPSLPLEIAYSKTTNIVFPYAIKSVDRGSKDVLAQKAGGIENVLQLKAAREDFEETNLTVVTADGKLYSFTVTYAVYPLTQNLTLASEGIENGAVHFAAEKINEADVQLNCVLIAGAKKKNTRKKDAKFGISLVLDGLFVQENAIYYRFHLQNDTYINYDIQQLRFFIRDQKKTRRTARQEVEVKPVFVEGSTDRIAGKSQQVVVFALPKFTIPDQKYLAIQLMENSGGRHLSLKVSNKTIIRAEPIEKVFSNH